MWHTTSGYISANILVHRYVKSISEIIAKAQITNGGPVILLQPENEYSQAVPGVEFPNYEYMQTVEDQYRKAGIVVPFISNDAGPNGYFAPGNGTVGNVDIYGHDAYPQGFDCANPYVWAPGALPTYFHTLHEKQSPNTPYSIVEFQGGSFDPWGGPGFAKCEELTNNEFERVFYKNDFSFVVTVFNIYMTFGGTNWGNLGYALGYTSYDYGSVIAEDRTVTREKFSEAKLEANFLVASPAYLTATTQGNASNGSFATPETIAVTQMTSNQTGFYVVRHGEYQSNDTTQYTLKLPTSKGKITIPQLSKTLTLIGRDSKIHVVDYDLGGTNLLYSSGEIFTWKQYGSKKVLVLYGGVGETHEFAITTPEECTVVEGQANTTESNDGQVVSSVSNNNGGITTKSKNGALIVNWTVEPKRRIVQIGQDLFVYLLDRNYAYNYWVLDLPAKAPVGNYTNPSGPSVIVKAGYLLRTAAVDGKTLSLTGDLNATTDFEVIGAPDKVAALSFNGAPVKTTKGAAGSLTGTVAYQKPDLKLPDLTTANWKVINSLPEIQNGYDDSKWTAATLTTTKNPRKLTTPVSLYASDYGYFTGTLLFRGHFKANGKESTLFLQTQGGTAFGYSIWLNETFVGSWDGISIDDNYNQTLNLPKCTAGVDYVMTIVIDTNGLEEENVVGSSTMKHPRGILGYKFANHKQSDITWKLTGNLGGESYADHTRGPLNEGGMYAERQGYHLPNTPTGKWKSGSPTDGLTAAGINFYSTTFKLNLPTGYDIPLAFTFANTTTVAAGSLANAYRVQLFVNGYQYGKYGKFPLSIPSLLHIMHSPNANNATYTVNNIGPQTVYPVPPGILNTQGTNYVALSLWSLENGGSKLEGLTLNATAVIESSIGKIASAPQPGYSVRPNAY